MAIGKKTGGRQKGTTNKKYEPLRDVFLGAFHEMQLKPKVNLSEWGESNPTEFYRLCAKLINIQISNDPDNPMPTTIIQIIPDPNSAPIAD
jgi:hypothetical protein